MHNVALIVAGGKGERMNAGIPKQFIEINGKPILMHTLGVFHQYDPTIKLVVVLPSVQIDFWKQLCCKHDFNLPHCIVEGGETRFHSVRNGLNEVKVPAMVAVHDGVRPLVSIGTISRCFEKAIDSKAVIPVIDLVDSIRYVDESGSRACDRAAYKAVQTPQVFDAELLKKAYLQDYSPLFTDDASVVEALGAPVALVEGNRENIKITTPQDIALATVLNNSTSRKYECGKR